MLSISLNILGMISTISSTYKRSYLVLEFLVVFILWLLFFYVKVYNSASEREYNIKNNKALQNRTSIYSTTCKKTPSCNKSASFSYKLDKKLV